jgi:hypothetical protein
MKLSSLAAVAFALGATVASAQDKLAKEDVAKLARAGVSDDLILAVLDQAKASFVLSADEVLALKKDGVSDKVLAAMMGKAAPKVETPVKPAGGGNLTIKNTSQRGVKVVVDERNAVINFVQSGSGSDLDQNASLTFAVGAGEYAIAVEGARTRHTAQLPATILVRGADTEYVDVMTLTVEDGRGREVMIMHSQHKVTAGQQPRSDRVYTSRPGYFYGPQLAYLPIVTHRVYVGAGIGVAGYYHHRHVHTTGFGVWVNTGGCFRIGVRVRW